MSSKILFGLSLFVLLCFGLLVMTTEAAVIVSGDTDPESDDFWWTHGGFSLDTEYIGKTGTGYLEINSGSEVEGSEAYVGYGSGSIGTVLVTGSGSEWDIDDGISVGWAGRGTLTVNSGGYVVSDAGYLGYESGSSGTATVSGGSSNWTTGRIDVGRAGNGTLTINNGGYVVSADSYLGYESGSSGTATVDGSTSTWNTYDLEVGSSGNGTLNVTNGGKVSSWGSYLGYENGSSGTATIYGSSSTWSASYLEVGSSGDGTLNITGGGTANILYTTYVARHDGSSGRINFENGLLNTDVLVADVSQLTGTGTIHAAVLMEGLSDLDLLFDASSGSTTTIRLASLPEQDISINLTPLSWDDLSIGYSGNASLTIRDGVVISSKNGCLGINFGASATANIEGSGSSWNISDTLYVGKSGSGHLHISDGASVSCTMGYICRESGSSGTVSVAGADSTWNIDAVLSIGGSGTLDVTGGGTVECSDGYINDSSIVTIDGPDSSWVITDDLKVSGKQSGSLNIINAGSVSCDLCWVDYNSGASGDVTVSGAASSWNIGSILSIGNYGKGTVNILDGGTVSVNYNVFLGNNVGSAGSATVDGPGSNWDINSTMLVLHRI